MTDPAAHIPDVDTLAAGIGDAMANAVTLTSAGDLERAASMIDLHAERLSELAATARERDYKLVDSSVAADRDRLARRVAELEAALRAEFLRILPELDYETQSGAWGWEAHPWFDLLGITDEECCEHIRALAGDGGGA